MDSTWEKPVRITKLETLSPLPALLRFQDGTPVTTPEDWQRRRAEVYDAAITAQYGQIPPAPETLTVTPLCLGSSAKVYRITAGPEGRAVSFRLCVFYPAGVPGPWPVAIDGDLCWEYPHDRAFIRTFTDRGMALAVFDRTELVSDVAGEAAGSPLCRAYPELRFGALAGWAWGYARCVDALLSLGLADPDCIAFTGHSRGGKAALLAGVLDPRAAIVNPNDSGCGGAGCYRVLAEGIDEDGGTDRNENLEDILHQFYYWFAPSFADWEGRAAELPFDQHFVKALVAPRVLLEGNAASDLWANPVGSRVTAEAADSVYELLGAAENHLWYYRPGFHYHKISDVERLASVMEAVKSGTAFPGPWRQDPFLLPL